VIKSIGSHEKFDRSENVLKTFVHSHLQSAEAKENNVEAILYFFQKLAEANHIPLIITVRVEEAWCVDNFKQDLLIFVSELHDLSVYIICAAFHPV